CLQWIGGAPRRTKNRGRGKPGKVRRRQRENGRSVQLAHRGFKEAFTPGAANGQALVKRLPAQPHLGHQCIRIIILPRLIAVPGCELQRIEPRDIKLGTENRNEYFRIKRVLFAPSPNRRDTADTHFLSKALLVIRTEKVGLIDPRPAECESPAACG